MHKAEPIESFVVNSHQLAPVPPDILDKRTRHEDHAIRRYVEIDAGCMGAQRLCVCARANGSYGTWGIFVKTGPNNIHDINKSDTIFIMHCCGAFSNIMHSCKTNTFIMS